MDPIEALRLCILRKQTILYDDVTGVYTLGDQRFSKTAESSWQNLESLQVYF